jgi:hypothetical protein
MLVHCRSTIGIVGSQHYDTRLDQNIGIDKIDIELFGFVAAIVSQSVGEALDLLVCRRAIEAVILR